MSRGSSPMVRLERQLAVGRLALASFSLLAVWLDPTEPHQNSLKIFWLLASYVLYALLLAVHRVRTEAPSRYRLLGYLVDLGTAFAAVVMSAGVSSPLFPLVVFALFVATRRWERGFAVWATGGVLASFLLLGALASFSRDASFEINDFVIRSSALVLIAAFLLHVATVETRTRAQMALLAAPPPMVVQPLDQLVSRILRWAVEVSGARRAVLVWEDDEEPWLYLAESRDGACRHAQESPQSMAPIVAPALAAVSFLCRRAGSPEGMVFHRSAAGTGRWRGAPIHAVLQARFSMDATLSLVFDREYVKGRLFLLDKPDMTTDDLTLGEVVTGHIAGRLNHFYLRQRLSTAAIVEERLRMARDLHDGAFHTLTGVALEIERLLRTPDIELARSRIREIRDSLAEGQRGVRDLIDGLRVGPEPAPGLGLEVRFKALTERLARQWRVEIRCTTVDCEDLPAALADEIYLMVHEALVNIGRHAGATTASAGVTARPDRVTIVVTDNGRGFGFTGRHDHETLVARRIGPWSLLERAACLGGQLTIEGGSGLTTLEIELPVGPAHGATR